MDLQGELVVDVFMRGVLMSLELPFKKGLQGLISTGDVEELPLCLRAPCWPACIATLMVASCRQVLCARIGSIDFAVPRQVCGHAG